MGDAEALFLVYDDEAKVFESHVFLDDAMGADADVDLAVRQRFDYVFLFFRRSETAQHVDQSKFE